MLFTKVTGDIPQNVDFAIKGCIVQSFLDIHGVQYSVADAGWSLFKNTADVAKKARGFTVPVECWK